MRRILSVVVLVALVAVTGCTTEDKQQWHKALGDLNGKNTETIAPLSKHTPD